MNFFVNQGVYDDVDPLLFPSPGVVVSRYLLASEWSGGRGEALIALNALIAKPRDYLQVNCEPIAMIPIPIAMQSMAAQ